MSYEVVWGALNVLRSRIEASNRNI